MLRYTPALLALSIKSAPTCENPGDKNVENGMAWYSCPLDDNAWYGVSKGSTFDRPYAINSCNSFEGGELVSIRNEDMDQCAYYALRLEGEIKSNVWQSLFYSSNQDKYIYCVNGTDFLQGQCYTDNVEYTNWDSSYVSGDDCASLSISGMNFADDYTWIRENCGRRLHFMCRVDCSLLPTPEPPTTLEPPTTKFVTDEPIPTVIPPWERQIDITINEGDFGNWQNSQTMCQYNGYVCGLTTRYQDKKNFNQDDSALNGITLDCCDWEDSEDHFPQIKVVSTGFEGELIRNFNCGKYKYICGMRARYSPKNQHNDETGLNGIEVQCCDKYIWASHETYTVNTGDWGDWQDNFTKCPQNYYVCGMSMQEQKEDNGWRADNTAANGIKVSCCNKPTH